MSVDVLVTGSVLYTGRDIVRDAFVYVKGGRVMDYGRAPVPEDYTYAALVVGGPGRIVAPGLAAYIDAPAYVIRGLKPRLAERARFYSSVDLDSLRYASLPAVYEAHSAGVTTLVTEAPQPRLALDLSELAGGFYGAAIPACIAASASASIPTVTVGGEGCDGGDAVVNGGEVVVGGRRVLALVSRLTYSRLPPGPYGLSMELRRALGIPGGYIEKGVRAELVVFNASRPPGMLADLYDLELDEVYAAGLAVESVIAGDEVLVDAGEHLRVTGAHFREVRRFAERILRPRGGR